MESRNRSEGRLALPSVLMLVGQDRTRQVVTASPNNNSKGREVMAIGKIEPTGCTVRKGKVQLKFSFYLEPSDPRYEEHHIQVPIIPEGGYPGEVGADGSPVDQDAYNAWIESLPKEWQDNPFHNHFIYVDPDITEAEIKQLMAEALDEFFGIWTEGEDILKAWRTRPLKSKKHFVAGDLSDGNIKKCQSRVKAVTSRVLDFEVRKV